MPAAARSSSRPTSLGATARGGRRAARGGGLASSIATVNESLELKDGVLAAFRQWDTTGSGGILLPEMKKVLLALGVPEGDVPKIFSLADCNKDGIIDYEEFVSWLWAVAPAAMQRAQACVGQDDEPESMRRPHAAECGGHPEMSPLGDHREAKVILATCKLAAPVCPHLDFTVRVAPTTRIAELAMRICENHGGSICDPVICVNRFHPEEIRSQAETLEDCGVTEGNCVVYYDYVAQAGAVLA